MFESEDVKGRETRRAEAVLSGRVQHEERLSGQGHLCTVRRRTSWLNLHMWECGGVLLKKLRVGACFCDFNRHPDVKPSYLSSPNLSIVFPNRLFEWLVTFINNSICADETTWCNFIGKSLIISYITINTSGGTSFLHVLPVSPHHAPPLCLLQEFWMCTALSVSTPTTWSSCALTMQMRNCSSTLWLIISELSRLLFSPCRALKRGVLTHLRSFVILKQQHFVFLLHFKNILCVLFWWIYVNLCFFRRNMWQRGCSGLLSNIRTIRAAWIF